MRTSNKCVGTYKYSGEGMNKMKKRLGGEYE